MTGKLENVSHFLNKVRDMLAEVNGVEGAMFDK